MENTAQSNTNLPVAIAAPTGSVTVTSTLTGLSGTVALSPGVDSTNNAVVGVATISVPAGTISGNYQLSATYAGDGNYNTASLPIFTFGVETTSGDGGLTSSVAATLSGSISPTTNVIVSGTVTGQSGSAAPTGSVYVYSSGNYPIGASLVPGTGDSSTFTIVLNSQTLFQGSNQITLQYFGDSKYNPSATVLTTAISNPLSDFALTAEAATVPVTAGSTGTTVVNLAPINGFSGAVSLTCTASGIACTIPSSEALTSAGSASATLTLSAASSTVDGTYNVLIVGKDSTGAYVHTLGISAVVTGGTVPTPGFTLVSGAAISMVAGASSGNTAGIGITPSNGFTGTVGLTCSVAAPTGATSPVTLHHSLLGAD